MAIDPTIHRAIREAVDELRQPDPVAVRLIAWMTALADGNEQLSSQEKVRQRLDDLYEATTVDLASDRDGESE